MKCIYCKNDKFTTLFIIKKRKIIKCRVCGLVKTDSDSFENYENYHRDDKEYKRDEEMFRNIFKLRYKTITKFVKNGKILDIGSSTGTMLSIFKDNGWDVLGVEPSSSADYAKKRGIRTINQTFEKAKIPTNSYDVVILNHTFEHVEKPMLVLNKIYTVLKKGGIVYIDVPNFESLNSKIKGKKWGYLMPEEHVYHFTPATLQNIIKKAGFDVVWWNSWSGIFDVASIYLLFKFNLVNLRKAFFKNALFAPLNVVTTVTKRGSSLAVIGRKK